jgi:site-specific recombinase XerD
LLAVTGLRPSEGRKLKLTDLTTDGLVIRASKFRKTRLVPLHATTTAALQSYLAKRSKVAGHDEHLFVSKCGRQLPRRTVSRTFHKVVEAAGIARRSGRSSPHLMDLRHTFAVRVLERCPDNRDHVRRHMLALTTYMGHARVEDTYWYLESTPELMVDIARATETFVKGGTP